MSVKYSWSRQNGAAVPPVRFMSIEPAEDYYKGMPLKLKDKGIVEPTDGDPEYICMAQYDPDAEIQPLEIPVQEVFPDVIYEKINNDGTTEEVRFGSRGGGGGIKTVNGQKPDANGNVEVTAGVQSDMYETNPESMAFVKNNPIESGVVELAFDGNYDNKTIIEGSMEGLPVIFVKMSDDTPVVEDLLSVTYDQNDGNGVQVAEGEALNDFVQDNANYDIAGYNIGSWVYVVTEESPNTAFGNSLAKGVWFMGVDLTAFGQDKQMAGLGLTYKAKKVKTSLIPSHSHKWNDISDAPFGEKTISVPLNFVFDGDVTGKETGSIMGEMTFVKMSNAVPTAEQLVDSTLVYVDKGEETTVALTSDTVIDSSLAMGVPGIILVQAGSNMNAMIVYGDTSFLGSAFSEGVWFYAERDDKFTKSLTNPNVTITTTEIKKLDSKFIDQVCGETDHVLFSAQNAEFYNNSDQTTNAGKAFVMFDIPKLPIKAGREYIVKWDDEIYNCTAFSPMQGMVILGNIEYAMGAGDSGIPFAYVFVDLSHLGDPGVVYYFMDVEATEAATGYSAYHDFSISGVAPTRLPEELMPLSLPYIVLRSSTPTSVMKFRVTVDDDGNLKAEGI